MRITEPDRVLKAQALRSRLREQEGKLAVLLSACRETIQESRRIMKKSKNALVQLNVIHCGGQARPPKSPSSRKSR